MKLRTAFTAAALALTASACSDINGDGKVTCEVYDYSDPNSDPNFLKGWDFQDGDWLYNGVVQGFSIDGHEDGEAIICI